MNKTSFLNALDKLVSILIPCYNAERFLAETLKSALDQSHRNLEIILVDDGSTDQSLEIARSFQSEKLTVLSRTNQGASAARNLAFQHAKGDFIQYLDADDLLAPDKIERQLEMLAGSSERTVSSSDYCFFTASPESAFTGNGKSGNKDYSDPIDWLLDAAYDKSMFPPVVWLTSRKLIESAGKWNEKLSYNDDPEFFSRVLLQATQILFCEKAMSYYRIGNAASLGSRKSPEARISEFESLSLLATSVLESENSERVKKALAYNFSKLNYSLYPEFPELRSRIEQKLLELAVPYPKNFGNGFTSKLGKFLGWKIAKRIRKSLK